MKFVAYCGVLTAGLLFIAANAKADTAWSSTSGTDWGTGGNWTNGIPSFGPQLAIHPGTASLARGIALGATARETVGMRFLLTAGGIGYTFTGFGANAGFFIRSGGSANGIINSDDSVQTFSVPTKLLDGSRLAGAGAAQTWNAAAGNMVFNGSPSAASPWTLNLNGASALTISGAGNVSIGTSGAGQIVNTNVGTSSGFIKNGTGTLFLGGSSPNTFSGTNVINAGKITAGKVNSLGAGNGLVVSGGTFDTGGFSHTNGILDLNGSALLDFGSGSTTVSFADSSDFDWSGGALNVTNWTAGVDFLRFGTDESGLTEEQLASIHFLDSGLPFAQIDGNGFLTPVPEPSAGSIAMLGLVSVVIARRIFARRS